MKKEFEKALGTIILEAATTREFCRVCDLRKLLAPPGSGSFLRAIAEDEITSIILDLAANRSDEEVVEALLHTFCTLIAAGIKVEAANHTV